MLKRISSRELSEWVAYFKLKEKHEKQSESKGTTNKTATF